MSRALAALALGCLAFMPLLAADPKPDCAARPTWCQPGYVCLPTACAAEAAAQLDLLTADVEALKKRRIRKWACTLGPGAGVYLQIVSGKTTFDAAPLAGAVVCGWTF